MNQKRLAAWFVILWFLVAMGIVLVGHAAVTLPVGPVSILAPVSSPAAATVGTADPVVGPLNLDPVASWIEGQAAVHPWIVTAFLVLGALRFFLKPIVAAAHWIAEQTATPKDDELIATIESSRELKVAMFVFDWLCSLKIRK